MNEEPEGAKVRLAFLERLRGKLVRDVSFAPEVEAQVARHKAYLQVLVGVEHLALPVDDIEEVVADAVLTPVPRAPSVVLGVFLHRGALLPVLATAHVVGTASPDEPAPYPRIVVAGAGQDAVGLVVRATQGVVQVEDDQWRELPRETWRYVRKAARIGGDLVGLLDVPQILALDLSDDELSKQGRAS